VQTPEAQHALQSVHWPQQELTDATEDKGVEPEEANARTIERIAAFNMENLRKKE